MMFRDAENDAVSFGACMAACIGGALFISLTGA
jgi:hypothetical protein